jgi:hypothetical protein
MLRKNILSFFPFLPSYFWVTYKYKLSASKPKKGKGKYITRPNMATIYPLDVSANIRELKIHQIYDADVTKNCRYYHSFISRVKTMDGCW